MARITFPRSYISAVNLALVEDPGFLLKPSDTLLILIVGRRKSVIGWYIINGKLKRSVLYLQRHVDVHTCTQ